MKAVCCYYALFTFVKKSSILYILISQLLGSSFFIFSDLDSGFLILQELPKYGNCDNLLLVRCSSYLAIFSCRNSHCSCLSSHLYPQLKVKWQSYFCSILCNQKAISAKLFISFNFASISENQVT